MDEGKEGWWNANQYRAEMKPGDFVFFWLAGDRSYRGIYGWGKLTSEPYLWEEDDKKYYVDYICEKRIDPYLPIQKIESKPELQNIQILNMPIGSNFLLNEKEGKAIFDMIDNEFRTKEV